MAGREVAGAGEFEEESAGADGFAWLAATGLAGGGFAAGDCAATPAALIKMTQRPRNWDARTDIVTLSRIPNLSTLRGIAVRTFVDTLQKGYARRFAAHRQFPRDRRCRARPKAHCNKITYWAALDCSTASSPSTEPSAPESAPRAPWHADRLKSPSFLLFSAPP